MSEQSDIEGAGATLREAITPVPSLEPLEAPLHSALKQFEEQGLAEAADLASYIIDEILPGRVFAEHVATFERVAAVSDCCGPRLSPQAMDLS